MSTQIQQYLEQLQNGNLLIFFETTGFYLACDGNNELAVNRLLEQTKNYNPHYLRCFVAHQAQLERHVNQLPEVAYDLLDHSTKPLSLVLEGPKGISKSVIPVDDHLAFRLATDPLIKNLLQRLGRAVMAFRLNEMELSIFKGVNYVVNLPSQNKNVQEESIIRLSNNGTIQIIKP